MVYIVMSVSRKFSRPSRRLKVDNFFFVLYYLQHITTKNPCNLVDIETYNVDKQLNKVIVTGNVTNEEVIGVLHKAGKNATVWENVQC